MPDRKPKNETDPNTGSDPFFHLEYGGQFNACIGKQAIEENYIDGYMEAALELASAVVDKRQFGKRDTLAMPILYNARHAVELHLKYAIKNIRKLGWVTEGYRADHDIGSHFRRLRDARVGDERLRAMVQGLTPYVESLSSIDDDGQELRYAVNRDGKRSLEDHALIDLGLVQTSLESLAEMLLQLKYRLEDLREEKASGAWTKECSRADLVTIAKLLPDRVDWTSDLFTDAKRAVTRRFGLSGRKFSRALDAIQASRECKLHIGLETNLRYLTDDHAKLVATLWRERHPAQADKSTGDGIAAYSTNRDWSELRENRKRRSEANAKILRELAAEEIADLEVTFYIARERYFPEFYDEMLERTLREHALAPDLSAKIEHLIQKTNFGENLTLGLNRLGRPSLADEIGKIVGS